MSDHIKKSDLTGLQEAFVMHYLGYACQSPDAECDGRCRLNALESARQAGYKSPVDASYDNMIEKSKCRQYIRQEIDAKIPDDLVLMGELVAIAVSPLDSADVKVSDKRQALKDLFELRGKYVKKMEITGKDGGPLAYENLDDDELDARIKNLEAILADDDD